MPAAEYFAAAVQKLKADANTLTNPACPEEKRKNAATSYAKSFLYIDHYNEEEGGHLARVFGFDLNNFLLVAEDYSESEPIRRCTLDMAIGKGIVNMVGLAKHQSLNDQMKNPLAGIFKSSATPIGRAILLQINFASVYDRILEIAERENDLLDIRKAAMDLANRITEVVREDFLPSLDYDSYNDRFRKISQTSKDILASNHAKTVLKKALQMR